MATDIKNLKVLAKQKEDENRKFRQFLKFYDKCSKEELDVESTIKCTCCGQCCKELNPTLSQRDQQRLADGLGMTVVRLRNQYLEYDDEKSTWQIKGTPCLFQKDNTCTVYAHRPQDCRDFEHGNTP